MSGNWYYDEEQGEWYQWMNDEKLNTLENKGEIYIEHKDNQQVRRFSDPNILNSDMDELKKRFSNQ